MDIQRSPIFCRFASIVFGLAPAATNVFDTVSWLNYMLLHCQSNIVKPQNQSKFIQVTLLAAVWCRQFPQQSINTENLCKQSFANVLQNRCSQKFHRKTPLLESLYRCFPIKLGKFLRTSFFEEQLRWLL